MPKIEVIETSLYKYTEKKMSRDELEEILMVAKAELDDIIEEEGIIKIELNDTNRPDLWSTAGLGRQIKIYQQNKIPSYDIFSTSENSKETGDRVIKVDPDLKEIRPYIAAFGVKGMPIDEPMLLDIIQTQEKVCWNYGQKRKSIAMGIYRSDLFSYPVKYKAADPDKTRFIPLQMEKELSLREIIAEHPKGQEFGDIVSEFKKFPFITDSNDEVLSFPPVINSSRIGAVEIGDSELFVEMTGTDLPSLLLAASMVSCDFVDSGYTILPVKIEYPYDTPFGREIVTPFYFQKPVSVDIEYVNKLLGEQLTTEEAKKCIEKMGSPVRVDGNKLIVTVPVYRNDFLHPVDIVEDIMIGRGMNSFKPVLPGDFTIGRLTDQERFARRVKDILVGLGFQEMIYNYLGSAKEFIEKIYPADKRYIPESRLIQIANPMTENYEYVRASILPSFLSSESVSGNAVYPHNLFEIGKVAFLCTDDNSGTDTRNYLGFFTADKDAGFTLVNSHVSAVMFYLSKEYTLRETDDPRFIKGRSAEVIHNGKSAGVFGELSPAVLANWGIQTPCTSCELDMDILL